MTDQEVMNVAEAAAFLRVSTRVFLEELAKGRIPRLVGTDPPRFSPRGFTNLLSGSGVVLPGHTMDPWSPPPTPPRPIRQPRHAGARRQSVRLRFLVLERCGFACVYCGRRPPEVALHVDHVHPIAAGGRDEDENLVAACQDCNLGKAARTGVRR